MERGLYIAAAGMLSEMTRQDLLANDLANANTPGYKADRAAQHAFANELDLVNRRTGQAVGSLGLGAQIEIQRTDVSPEPVRDTGEPLDLAITGDGWFSVRTAEGVRYTRDGSFAANAQGQLVDQLGDPVLGVNGQPVTVRPDGSVDPATVGVTLLTDVRKVGDGRYDGTVGAAGDGVRPGEVRTCALESSGVDPARAMVDMMASLRAFETGQRAITTIDDTLRLAANQVGTVSG